MDVDVTFELSKEMQGRVTTESTAAIGSVSLLGESALDLTASARGRALKQDEYVKSKRAPGQLADVAEGATRSLEQATLLLKDIRAGKGTVGKLFTDEALYRDVQGFVDAAESVAQSLRAGRGTAGKLLNDDKVYTRSLRVARTSAGHHDADQRRGGQPGQAAEGSSSSRIR